MFSMMADLLLLSCFPHVGLSQSPVGYLCGTTLTTCPSGELSTRIKMVIARPGEVVYSRTVEKMKILVVEDEPDHLMAVTMILEREGDITVLGAANTLEAEKILGETAIDTIFLDIALPGEDGINFCRRIRERKECASIPIIAISAYPEHLWKEKALEAGCTDYLSKPFDPDEIIGIIREHTDRS